MPIGWLNSNVLSFSTEFVNFSVDKVLMSNFYYWKEPRVHSMIFLFFGRVYFMVSPVWVMTLTLGCQNWKYVELNWPKRNANNSNSPQTKRSELILYFEEGNKDPKERAIDLTKEMGLSNSQIRIILFHAQK